MGRLITFVVGILVGVALKWQYDQQSSLAPAPQTTERGTASPRPSATAVQEIAITVQETNQPVTTPPAQPTENRASPPDAG
ncbi:MAG: hypothetical protein DYG89_27470 [Caldilinea sp. CFX5]|nr:hypothetical protein [Caldilinea sp. CFX5]